MPKRLQPVAVDRDDFEMPFSQSAFTHDEMGVRFYLDRNSGDTVWLYESDKEYEAVTNEPATENRELRQRIKAEPKRFLRIPGLTQDDDSYIIHKFLRSGWTDDEDLSDRTFDAYTGSIGKWKRRVERSTVIAFHEFEREFVSKMGEEFLEANGIKPQWR